VQYCTLFSIAASSGLGILAFLDSTVARVFHEGNSRDNSVSEAAAKGPLFPGRRALRKALRLKINGLGERAAIFDAVAADDAYE
jgi:hypothetical protein